MIFSVNQRLVAIIAGAVIAVLITGLIGFFSSQQISEELKYTDENIIRSLGILSSAERDFLLIRVNALYHLSYDDRAKKAPHEATIRRNIQEIQKRLADYEQNLIINSRDRELLQNDKQLFAIYLAALEKVLEKSNDRDREAAVVVVESEWKPAGDRLTAAFAEHSRYKERLVDQVVLQSMNKGRSAAWIVLLVTIVSALLLVVFGYLFKSTLPPRQN
ncbi:Four helix bundle sensory module for signal transduction [Formivibrio citricus]|uniref:Four helix bundle sensory module for signal transduction n=1 Tax=Formivibrio citricus TaxID=83765 RepID=A0A1I4WRW8_9NEIS|nr:MCP four helix bundle domain-containing protein [Formivibrio citricus]SFN16571.1 Four helix bundle sensory module for signal transduction [Formivibrio citricus]